MDLNSDFTKRAVAHGERTAWTASPMAGVERRMLDRVGDDVARATTIVRYAPHSVFSPHTHGGGEEFFVLEGVFQDEHGEYPPGTYVRNPPTSRHTPRSDRGCTILVKLWQFDPGDRKQLVVRTNEKTYEPVAARAGVRLLPLYDDARENVRLERWSAGADIVIGEPGGIELFVLEGGFSDGVEVFGPQSWLRLPTGERATVRVGKTGCRLWVKSGHLAHMPALPTDRQGN